MIHQVQHKKLLVLKTGCQKVSDGDVIFVTREEDEAEDVGAVGELASDLPAVEVDRITQASAVVESLVARIGQNGPILLQGCLKKIMEVVLLGVFH